MLKRRNSEGFNLAFLDVMACGLGAVILIFMLVKFNAQTSIPSEETERLEAELEQLTKQKEEVEEEINTASNSKTSEANTLKKMQSDIRSLKQQAKSAEKAIKDKEAVIANLEKSVAAAAPHQAEDIVELAGKGEENYLLGLNVKGDYIGILLDYSASMTDEKLVDIIRRKISSESERRVAPKWLRAKRVARWVLARVPRDSKLSMVSFNKEAQVIGPRSLITAENKVGIKQISNAIDNLIPEEGTNLQSAIKKIVSVNPKMTNLYIITDGLPTLGDRGSDLESIRNCRSFSGKSTTISGVCREKLFNHTIANSGLKGVEVNIILLPLEGDPRAANHYWRWASYTGGLLLSPAEGWP